MILLFSIPSRRLALWHPRPESPWHENLVFLSCLTWAALPYRARETMTA
jgi:hypothetical protein